jgi:hypothetical protein
MRKLAVLVFAFGLLLGIAGSTLADCGVGHANPSSPSSEQPRPQA